MIDISFKPEAKDFFKIDNGPTLFDSAIDPVERSVLNPPRSFMEKHGRDVAVSAIALQSLANTFSGKAQVSNLFANISRKRSNIEQYQASLFDSLNIQARKVSRTSGTQMAELSRSGVTSEGSPLAVMAETFARGMQDYNAIAEQGQYAISSAYQSIYDDLDRVKDIGTSMVVNSVASLAQGAFTWSQYK